MAERYCPNCGTEVDADARFCPTCGVTLEDEQPELPPAPTWPEAPPAEGASTEGETAAASPPAEAATNVVEPAAGEQLTLESPPPDPGAPPPAPAERQEGEPTPAQGGELPWQWPTTLSGWLIGGGSAVGALALISSLGDPVSLLLFLALLGVTATVFVADRLPTVPRLRLIVLSVDLVGLGVALERAGFRASGADSLLLVAMIAAAGGAILIELDRDRPVPPPSR